MPLTRGTINALYNGGFTLHEITQFNEAPNPIDINMPVVKDMIRQRLTWVNKLRDSGWADKQIIENIRNFYRTADKRSPFDFLKAEYKPPKRVDWQKIKQERYRVKTKDLYKGQWRYR